MELVRSLPVTEFKELFHKDVEAIRDSLREENSPELDRRRRIIALAALGLLDFVVISLYQTGLIRSMPDLPFKVFDSDSVNASKKAYATGLPDGTSGATMYGVIMMLASYGGKKGIGRNKLFDFLLAGAVLANSAAGLQYLYDMAFKQKRACLYCVTGALLNLTMLPLALQGLKEKKV